MGKRLCALFAALVLLTLPVCAFAANLPTAKVEEIAPPTVSTLGSGDITLNYALRFTAEEVDPAQMAEYGAWLADFELVFNKDVPLSAITLAGQYQKFSTDWLPIELGKLEELAGLFGKTIDVDAIFPNRMISAGKPIRIMQLASRLLNEAGLAIDYSFIVDVVKVFNCGIHIDPEYLKNNPDLKAELSLRMYKNKNDTEGVPIGTPHNWKATPDPVPVIDAPQTGDDANLALFVLMAAASMMGLTVMHRRSRKQN